MSSVVSEASYILTSSILDLIDRIRKKKYRRKMFQKVEEAEKTAKKPPGGYMGFVKVRDRARIIGRHTKIVVDVPFYGQTEYEYTPEVKMYSTAAEVVSPDWFNLLKAIYSKIRSRG